MLDSFLVAINAVVPFFCYLSLGAAARAAKIVDEAFLQKLTKAVFALMFPFMSFYNVYSTGRGNLPGARLVTFIVIGVLALIGLLVVLVPRLVKENAKRGVIIQAVFRSNLVIFGIPLTVSVFGQERAAVTAMMVSIVVVIYNITAVIVLEMFNDRGEPGHKTTLGSLLVKVAKNPLLQGCVLGLVFYALRIRLPGCLEKPVKALSDMTSPLAMIALGGTLRFKAIAGNRRYLLPTLSARLVLIPLLMVLLGHAIGLRGVELFLVLVVFGTPVASGSYPMAMSMGGDGELAGQFVFLSTAASLVTLFIWIFCLGQMGLLV